MSRFSMRDHVRLQGIVWRELIALRKLHRNLSDDEFTTTANDWIREQYDDVEPDMLALLLKLAEILIPLILLLFGQKS